MFLFVVVIVFLVYLISSIFLSEYDTYFFVPLAVIFSLISSTSSYFWGDKMVLALSGAKKAQGDAFFELNKIVENIAIVAGVKTPTVYYSNDPSPNAFATGRDPEHASICVTSGLLQKLNRAELEGVIAHEIAHIKNFDTRLMIVITILVGFVSILADFAIRSMFSSRRSDDKKTPPVLAIVGLILILFSPLISQLIQLAISRNREFLADATGAYFTRYPKGLADALAKISSDNTVSTTANSGMSHLYISDPFKNKFLNLFSTHPPVKERIARLMAM